MTEHPADIHASLRERMRIINEVVCDARNNRVIADSVDNRCDGLVNGNQQRLCRFLSGNGTAGIAV